ncbi:hypothetical protein [Arenimonas donghaensis]|uniref:hypothetical protein n=1 Tax=Arenimonas donghaensis TaxID=375061 RepID=UPI0012679533|nr:hypothetical protein [Arenimonas donghaensis]
MRITAILTPVLALSASPASDKSLDELAVQLKAAKSSVSVAITLCPRSMDPFVGLAKGVVIPKLGAPDLDELGADTDGHEITVHQYLFANPDAGWIGIKVSAGGWTAVQPMGEPFTVVQFHYNRAGKIIAARCWDRA